jgi:hypothetical protein
MSAKRAPFMMLFRRGNRQKSTHRTFRIWLLSIPKEAFADSFQKLYERCQQCVVKDGDYFAGQ